MKTFNNTFMALSLKLNTNKERTSVCLRSVPIMMSPIWPIFFFSTSIEWIWLVSLDPFLKKIKAFWQFLWRKLTLIAKKKILLNKTRNFRVPLLGKTLGGRRNDLHNFVPTMGIYVEELAAFGCRYFRGTKLVYKELMRASERASFFSEIKNEQHEIKKKEQRFICIPYE